MTVSTVVQKQNYYYYAVNIVFENRMKKVVFTGLSRTISGRKKPRKEILQFFVWFARTGKRGRQPEKVGCFGKKNRRFVFFFFPYKTDYIIITISFNENSQRIEGQPKKKNNVNTVRGLPVQIRERITRIGEIVYVFNIIINARIAP